MTTRAPGLDDTIAAISTPPGRGGIAVVRVSGTRTPEILRRLCPELPDGAPRARQQVLTAVRRPESGELLDRALVTRYVAPASYTGEDIVEISCHGGELTPRLILDAAVAAGARPALPGEFTRRAYLNGKIDLVQAEAVADIIDSRSPAMRRAALHQMERGLSERLSELRSLVLRVEALAVYSIDFPEEDEPPVPLSAVREAAAAALGQIERVLRTAPEGGLLRRGPLVVLAGRPNSGKSSLFNALLGIERSIVTEVPGTTRDAVEAETLIDGYPFRLADTAGLRSTEDRVETLGIEVARRYIDSADVILFCVDRSGPLDTDEERFLTSRDEVAVIVAHTKADLQRGAIVTTDSGDSVSVSARTGEGLQELRERLLTSVFGSIRVAQEEPVLTRERHARALRSAANELRGFLTAIDTEIPIDLASTHLRAAAAAIEEIIGVVTADDILSAVFTQFCVGK